MASDIWEQMGYTAVPAEQAQQPTAATPKDDIWGQMGYTAVPDPTQVAPAKPESSFLTEIAKRLRDASMIGEGFNNVAASTIGGLPDLVGSGLSRLGVPGIRPGYFTDLAQRGLNAVTGPPVPPEGTLQNTLYGAGQGISQAASVAMPAAAVSTMLPAGIARGVATQLAANPITQMVAGGVGGATTAATGNPWLGMAANMATPIASGALRSLVSPGLSSMESMTPERQRLVQLLQDSGVPLTPAQQTGSPGMEMIEHAFANQPLTAGAQRRLTQAGKDAFASAAAAHGGMQGPDFTPNFLSQTRERIGGMIGDIAARNTLPITPQLDNAIDAATVQANHYLTDQQAQPVLAGIADLRKLTDPTTNTAPGEAFQNFDSGLASTLRGDLPPQARRALIALRQTANDAFRGNMSDPYDVQMWNQSKRQYANLMTIAEAMNRPSAGTAEGQLSPAALSAAANNPNINSNAFGVGDLRDLGAAGQAIMKDRRPESGTAGNILAMHMMGEIPTAVAAGLYTGNPGLAAAAFTPLIAPKIAQMLWNSRAGNAYLTNQLASGIPSSSGGLLSSSLAQQFLPGGLLNQGRTGQ